jgi:serine/threonine protein kinase
MPGEKGRDTMSDEGKLVSHYQLKTLLRQDGFGAVYLAEDTRDAKAHVLRVIELDPPTLARITGRVRARAQRDHPLIEAIRQRMKRIAELKHPHLLPVIGFGEEHVQGNNDIIFYMASPYEKESLLSYWSEHYSSTELLSLEVIADLVYQAGEALYAVHKRGLVHQYVRLSSFMLRARGRRLSLLLTDFWFADITAAILQEGQDAQALSIYLALEQLTGKAVAASDQYALALLAYELLLGYRLSQLDLSQGLYAHALRQRAAEIEVSEAELAIASKLDLVLARALAATPDARFENIEEFVYTFRSVARGEAIDLSDEATFKLPTVAAAAGGALAAGALVAEVTQDESTTEMLVAAEADEAAHTEHRASLRKTVLTSEGMEVVKVERDISVEQTQIVAGAAGAAGFVAGVAAGEALQAESDISSEQTQIVVAEAAGEMVQAERDSASEQARIMAAEAAGFAAGEAAQAERDISTEQTQVMAAGAAGFAAGEAVQRETDISEEETQSFEGGGVLLAGAAGLAAGGLLASELASSAVTQIGTAGAVGAGVAAGGAGIAGGAGGAIDAGAGAGLAGAGLEQTGEVTQIGAAGAAGSAGAGLVAGGAGAGLAAASLEETGEVTQLGAAGAGLAGAGLVVGGAAGAAGAASVGNSAAGAAAGTSESESLAGAGVGLGVAGAAAGAGLVAAGAGMAGGTTGAGGAARRGRGWSWGKGLIAAISAIVLVVIVTAGVMVYAANQGTATVTLTLQSHAFQNSYLLTAVVGSPGQGQITATKLTQSASQSQSGHASGYYAGSHATGFITFTNNSTGCGCPIIIPAGTRFTGASGVTVVTETIASVASQCRVTVNAYAIPYGPGGDIPVHDVNTTYHSTVAVTNPYAFGGGQPSQSHMVVQQSDLDSVANALQSQVVQSAQNSLKSQLTSGERLMADPSCQTKTTSDHAAGAVVSGFTVTVSATCTAEAFDYTSASQQIQQQVQTQTASYGSQFGLVGSLNLVVTSATVTDAHSGTILLAIKASGTWAYQFDKNEKKGLAVALKGKSISEARTILAGEAGVASFNIVTSNGGNSLPNDPAKITIVLKS